MPDLVHKFITALAVTFITVALQGQVNGDYQTRNNGNWNSNTTWQVYSGGAWTNCSTGDYPGAASGAGTVYILNNHTVTVSSDVQNSIGSLIIDSGTNNSFVQFSGSYSLTVTGQTYLNSSTTNWVQKSILVDSGVFRTGSVWASSDKNNRDAYIRISTGEVSVDGNITLNGTSRGNYFLFTGNGDLFIGGAITGGTITSNSGGGPQAPTSGTVIYNGTAAQNIGTYDYYNLEVDNSNGVSLTTDITISNGLTMTDGNISTGTNTLILTSSTSSNLSYTSGTIIGSLQRAIGTPTGTEYLFPVGINNEL